MAVQRNTRYGTAPSNHCRCATMVQPITAKDTTLPPSPATQANAVVTSVVAQEGACLLRVHIDEVFWHCLPLLFAGVMH